MTKIEELTDQYLIDFAFYYGGYIKKFDDSFVQEMKDRILKGHRLTENQRKGLTNIVQAGKKISGDGEYDGE